MALASPQGCVHPSSPALGLPFQKDWLTGWGTAVQRGATQFKQDPLELKEDKERKVQGREGKEREGKGKGDFPMFLFNSTCVKVN